MTSIRSAAIGLATAVAALAADTATFACAQSADRRAGEQIASVGNAQGAAACVSCHALDRTENSLFPLLAGQPAEYLYKQLNDYSTGLRENPIMGPIAKALSDGDRQNVAAYYESSKLPPSPGRSATSDMVQLGEMLSKVGSREKNVQACVTCHGPEARGEPPLNPQLAGQYASYTRAQLRAFLTGARRNDIAAVMREIARKLSGDEIASVAAYFQALPSVTAAPRGR